MKQAIRERRAYRSLDPVQITEDLIKDLAECARLAPSCNNNQPWRFVFVHDPDVLQQLHSTFPRGNKWMEASSMIIAVFSNRNLDCIIGDRIYYLFDTGMATAFLILRATELGLVAHPVAGYDEAKVKQILKIPDDMTVITLVNIGKHSSSISAVLSEKQVLGEKQRPERLPLEKFAYINSYKK
nr:nitroreductase family protein [Candidatus Njordarchaeum guaymaensis]